MRKLFSLILTLTLFLLSAVPAFAVPRMQMSEAERNSLDTFFSNFAEAGVMGYAREAFSPADYTMFGIRHNIRNREYDMIKLDDSTMGLKKEAVEAAILKYFGVRVNAVDTEYYKLSGNYYPVPRAGGEGMTFAQVNSFDPISQNSWGATLTFYSVSSGFAGDFHASMEKWQEDNKKFNEEIPEYMGSFRAIVTVSPVDSSRYVLQVLSRSK